MLYLARLGQQTDLLLDTDGFYVELSDADTGATLRLPVAEAEMRLLLTFLHEQKTAVPPRPAAGQPVAPSVERRPAPAVMEEPDDFDE